MNRVFCFLALLPVFVGCHSDVVATGYLKKIPDKCVYVSPIECQDPYVGKVLKDVLEKEFIRKHVRLCDADGANIILTGSTFMTYRAAVDAKGWGGRKSSAANEAIESVTITAKDRAGNILLTASYDNVEQFTASKLAAEFGSTLAGKFK